MRNKVIVLDAENTAGNMEEIINEELAAGWLIELFYEARGNNSNKVVVTLYRED